MILTITPEDIALANAETDEDLICSVCPVAQAAIRTFNEKDVRATSVVLHVGKVGCARWFSIPKELRVVMVKYDGNHDTSAAFLRDWELREIKY